MSKALGVKIWGTPCLASPQACVFVMALFIPFFTHNWSPNDTTSTPYSLICYIMIAASKSDYKSKRRPYYMRRTWLMQVSEDNQKPCKTLSRLHIKIIQNDATTVPAYTLAYCSGCKRSTEVVFDHFAGDTVRSSCELALEAHSIDETSEIDDLCE